MHDYTPKQNKKQAGVISLLLFAVAAVILICQNLIPIPKALLQLGAIISLVCGIQITTRYALTIYTYTISRDSVSVFEDELNRVGEVVGEENALWLRIAKTQGQNSRIIGGFPLSSVEMCIKGGRNELKEKLGDKYSEIKHSFNYCNRMFADDSYIAVVNINGEKLAVTLEPDSIISKLLMPESNKEDE